MIPPLRSYHFLPFRSWTCSFYSTLPNRGGSWVCRLPTIIINICVFSRPIADSQWMVHTVFSCCGIGLSFPEELIQAHAQRFPSNSKGSLEIQAHVTESSSAPLYSFSISPSFQIVTAADIHAHIKKYVSGLSLCCLCISSGPTKPIFPLLLTAWTFIHNHASLNLWWLYHKLLCLK